MREQTTPLVYPVFSIHARGLISDLIKNPKGKTYTKISDVGADAVCTSTIVACELTFGAVKRGSPQLADRIETSFIKISVLALDPQVRHSYAIARTQLERQGLPIGGNDLLIAAHALTLGLTLVTANVREFERVDGLRVENWL